MTQIKIIVGFLVPMILVGSESHVLNDVVQTRDEACENSCDRTYPTSPDYSMVKYSACCRRGCRFFKLVHLIKKKGPDLNATKESCESSCMEAYTHTKDRYSCNIGCATMAKQNPRDFLGSPITWAVYVEDGNNVIVIQPVDYEPDDVLTDPGLRRQLEHDFGIGIDDDRLPETHIRTMLGNDDKYPDVDLKQDAGDWLECAARKSGVPRLVLISIIVVAVLLALWLCLAPERQNMKLIQSVNLEEPFDLPPKYSVNIEQV